MKTFHAFVFAALVAGSACAAFAANKSETVVLNSAVKVGSTSLGAGDCKVSWSGDGPEVQVTFAEKGMAPVTVPATLVKEKHNHAGVTMASRDGGKAMLSVELPNVKLVIKDQAATGQ